MLEFVKEGKEFLARFFLRLSRNMFMNELDHMELASLERHTRPESVYGRFQAFLAVCHDDVGTCKSLEKRHPGEIAFPLHECPKDVILFIQGDEDAYFHAIDVRAIDDQYPGTILWRRNGNTGKGGEESVEAQRKRLTGDAKLFGNLCLCFLARKPGNKMIMNMTVSRIRSMDDTRFPAGGAFVSFFPCVCFSMAMHGYAAPLAVFFFMKLD